MPAIFPGARRWWRTALAGLTLSASVELSQLAVSLLLGYWYRMSDVDDVLLNVAGVLLGYGLFAAARRARSAPGRQRSVHE
jgi:glycopeptide antibiotics resistance protein